MWCGTEVPLLKKSFSFESVKKSQRTFRRKQNLRKEVEQAERVRPIKLDKNKI